MLELGRFSKELPYGSPGEEADPAELDRARNRWRWQPGEEVDAPRRRREAPVLPNLGRRWPFTN